MDRIVIFDTSLVTENMGDYIVMDYCDQVIKKMFPTHFMVRVPTHERISGVTYNYARDAKYKIVCGTNLMTGKMRKFNQWKLSLSDAMNISDVCLMGVGWRKYGEEPDSYSKWLWNRVLSHSLIHSVRDSYTEKMFRKMGFNNVLNTGCPTMWGLDEEKCSNIPKTKSNRVVMTTTRYNQDCELDNIMLDILLRQYEKVFFWIQSLEDYQYAKKLRNGSKLKYIPPRVDALDRLLEEGDIDYCGTRLHAGIRALNHGVRTIVVATDNRAIEIAKDTLLPICIRKEIPDKLEGLILNDFETKIKLPKSNIQKWMEQFKG